MRRRLREHAQQSARPRAHPSPAGGCRMWSRPARQFDRRRLEYAGDLGHDPIRGIATPALGNVVELGQGRGHDHRRPAEARRAGRLLAHQVLPRRRFSQPRKPGRQSSCRLHGVRDRRRGLNGFQRSGRTKRLLPAGEHLRRRRSAGGARRVGRDASDECLDGGRDPPIVLPVRTAERRDRQRDRFPLRWRSLASSASAGRWSYGGSPPT